MSVNFPEQLRRLRLHLCRTCCEPAAFLQQSQRIGVYCERHRKENLANYKHWVKTNPRSK